MNKIHSPLLSRRRLIAAGSSLVAAAVFPRLAISADAMAVSSVADNMHLVSGVGGNVLVVKSGSNAVLVDSGAADMTAQLQQALGQLQVSKVTTLFNTHWHLDQVGGNAHFGGQGASIMAHKKTALRLSTDYYLFDEERYQQALPESARPDQTFYDEGEMTTAVGPVEYGFLQSAHTDGDIYIRFPQANVIAVGDVVSPVVDPGFDWYGGGWIGGRVDALNHILSLCDAQTKVVPAYGQVVTRAHVEAERDLMQFMYETLVDQIRKGFDASDSLASGVMDNLPRRLDDPYRFLYSAHKGLWAHHNKLEPNIV